MRSNGRAFKTEITTCPSTTVGILGHYLTITCD